MKNKFIFFIFVTFISTQGFAFSHRPAKRIHIQEISADELESLLVKASRNAPPQSILEFLMRLSSQIMAKSERIIIRGDVWREVLRRNTCSLGAYNGSEITQFLPLPAIDQIELGAGTDSWVAVLDPKNPNVHNGVIKTEFLGAAIETGRSRRGERLLGSFGVMKHTYDLNSRSGNFLNIYGIVIAPKDPLKEAWVTGATVSNATKITAQTSHPLGRNVDLSKLTPIQCK